METRPLAIDGSFVFTPVQHEDRRGLLAVPFDQDDFIGATGHRLSLGQVNHAVSRKGTVRGVHFAQVPPGQAKYVYCPRGAVLDFIVDLRLGSPTFGYWESVRLDTQTSRAVYVPEGLGHAYVALEEDSTLAYLCSERFAPSREFGIDPFDPHIGLPWPTDLPQILSDRDASAPSLRDAERLGILPTMADCTAYLRHLRSAV